MNKTITAPAGDDNPLHDLYVSKRSDKELAVATHNLVAFVELLIEMHEQYEAAQLRDENARDIRTNSNENDKQEE